ncbi:hypothetical protein RHSIM_Rhsim10G0071600 [Rhododendron simsii]|uniref:Uncharacterized protein n=1 Tax=Rhododendron simsii TaxID=118357 RepID=A0A834GDN9_RHOSS|nr:hypothetical protein RHSIM_Rhsim10G0071600 [Rhododendron simsii]
MILTASSHDLTTPLDKPAPPSVKASGHLLVTSYFMDWFKERAFPYTLLHWYVQDLMGYMTSYLVEMSRKNDIKNVAQQPDVMLSVSCLLEQLRGAASASEPRTQKVIYEMGSSVMNLILILLEVYKHESQLIGYTNPHHQIANILLRQDLLLMFDCPLLNSSSVIFLFYQSSLFATTT